jgi:hypothetical protein
MKGVDYTKALARERDNYQNTIQKDRDFTSKRLADEENRHSEIQKKQTETFMRDKSKLEKDYQANLESIQEKTTELMDGEKENFHKINRNELKRFTKQRENMRKDFDQKMTNISDSYEKARINDKEFNQTIVDEKDARYKKNVANLTKDKDDKIAEYAKKFEGVGVENRDQMNLEKSQLTRAYQNQIKSMFQDEAEKRFQLKEGLQQDIDRTKAAYEAEKEMNQEYVKTRIGKVAANFDTRTEKMTSEYAKKNQDFIDLQKEKDLKTSKNHNSEMSDMRKTFERRLRNIELDKRRRDNGQGEFSDVINRQRGQKDEAVYNDKISRLKDDLSDARKTYDERSISEREKFRNTLLSQSSESARLQEKKEKELTADKIVELARHKESASRTLKNQLASQQTERIRHEEHLMQVQNQASGKIEKLKEVFNVSLQDLQEKNEKLIAVLQTATNEEKADFINNTQKQRSEEILELRRNFSKLMDSTIGEYETRIKSMERDNNRLKQDRDLRVSMVMENADNHIRLQQELYNEKKLADLKSNQSVMDARDSNFKNKILQLTDSFQQKMDNLSQANELKMKQIVNDYEAKLKIKDALMAKALSEKQVRHNSEINSLKSTKENEKSQLISQYENQINQLKQSQKLQTEQLNEYKRMS